MRTPKTLGEALVYEVSHVTASFTLVWVEPCSHSVLCDPCLVSGLWKSALPNDQTYRFASALPEQNHEARSSLGTASKLEAT